MEGGDNVQQYMHGSYMSMQEHVHKALVRIYTKRLLKMIKFFYLKICAQQLCASSIAINPSIAAYQPDATKGRTLSLTPCVISTGNPLWCLARSAHSSTTMGALYKREGYNRGGAGTVRKIFPIKSACVPRGETA